MTGVIEDLIAKRDQGAANIRGIHYQIMYSVLRGFDLFQAENQYAYLQLEGLEDLDLRGLYIGDEYVQAKHFKDTFSWSELKKPFERFFEAFRRDANFRFVLVCGGPISKGLKNLNRRETLSGKECRRLERNIHYLFKGTNISRKDGEALLKNLQVIFKPESEIDNELRRCVAEHFDLATNADVYISVMTSKFLKWAGNRRQVTRLDIEGLRGEIAEALASEGAFAAYGDGLVARVTWEADASETDFLEGKQTRAGHIVLGLDVDRPRWLREIDYRLNNSNTCVIVSSSGQGKSTLLYRYAHDQRNFENVFILKIAERPEHVQQVTKYLSFWHKVTGSSLLLVDNAGWPTQLWPFVAQRCSEIGIRVLVSTRQEDWFRFRRDSLTGSEIIEPTLGIDEARNLFRTLKNRGKVHPSVTKAEAAYDKVGKPHLLIEYIYLLTHGQLLENRLRDQIREIVRLKEDTGKIEILRCASLAHSLGTVVLTTKLLELVHLADDAQQVLQSLDGEYLKLEDGTVAGLHWVRSDHLVLILHEDFRPVHETALRIMDCVQADRLPMFIANALNHPIIDPEQFLSGLREGARTRPFASLSRIMDGIFEGGEKSFFNNNTATISQAYLSLGTARFKLFGIYLAPAGDPALRDRIGAQLQQLHEGFRELREFAEAVQIGPRGVDWCRRFLTSILPELNVNFLLEDLESTGSLLEWCGFCGLNLPVWDQVRDRITADKSVFDLELGGLSRLAVGLYRYDKEAYWMWFRENQNDILAYLRACTKSVSLDLTDHSVCVEFFVASDEEPNEQAVNRLKVIRHVLPFCDRYKSRGIWSMPYGLLPPVDDTIKDIADTDLPLNQDVQRNKVSKEVLEERFVPVGFLEYEEAWYRLRWDAVVVAEWVAALVEERLTRASGGKIAAKGGASSLESFELGVKFFLDPPLQMPSNLRDRISESTQEWAQVYYNFVLQLTRYLANGSDHASGRLAIVNFKEAMAALNVAWKAFGELFRLVPDYFEAQGLNANETLCYERLDSLLYAWILDPPNHAVADPLEYARRRREANQRDVLQNLEKVFMPIREAGINIVLPTKIHEDYLLKHAAIGVEVENPIRPELSIVQVAQCLVDENELVDFVYIMPLYRGCIFLKGVYRLAVSDVPRMLKEGLNLWDFLTLLAVPPELKKLLPEVPQIELPRLEIIGNVNALLGQLPEAARNYERISSLLSSENRFDIELYGSVEREVWGFIEQLKGTASRTRELVMKEFPRIDMSSRLITCLDFLERVKKIEDFEALAGPVEFGLANGAEILGDLLRAISG